MFFNCVFWRLSSSPMISLQAPRGLIATPSAVRGVHSVPLPRHNVGPSPPPSPGSMPKYPQVISSTSPSSSFQSQSIHSNPFQSILIHSLSYHPKRDHNSSTVRSNREASLPGEPSPKELSNRHEKMWEIDPKTPRCRLLWQKKHGICTYVSARNKLTEPLHNSIGVGCSAISSIRHTCGSQILSANEPCPKLGTSVVELLCCKSQHTSPAMHETS